MQRGDTIIISSREMKLMDSMTIEKIKIPSIVLMENAAIKFSQQVGKFNSYTIICGVGNNGGDGLAIARHLYNNGKKLDLFIIGELNKATKDFTTNLTILENMNISYRLIKNNKDLDTLKSSLKNNQLLIDSIFGIGLNKNITGLYKEVIKTINSNANLIASVDIPSGLNADTGLVMGVSIKADQTITFHLNKIGLVNNKDYTGDVIVVDISIPSLVTKKVLNM